MKVLRKGNKGSLVKQWQLFLVGEELLKSADGVFGNDTKTATIEFQTKNNLDPDGIVGNSCYGVAMTKGFELVKEPEQAVITEDSAEWPPKPDFSSLYNEEKRHAAFNKINFKADEKGKLIVLDGWKEKNIIEIEIPQLVGVTMWGKSKSDGKILFHKVAAQQMKDLWAEWEKLGLLKQVLTWNGTYSPRFIRGSTTKLSNHAYGTAFDINVKWNGLAKRPALKGQEGCLRELVPIAHKFGFYWGGHFRRKDGMHFEVAKVL